MTKWRRQHVITVQILTAGIILGVLASSFLAGPPSVLPRGGRAGSQGEDFKRARQDFVLKWGLDKDKSAEAGGLVEAVTVLCYVVVPSSNVPAKRQIYKQTWGKRCSRLLLFSDKASDGETIVVNSTTSTNIEEDAKASLDALSYLHHHHIEDAQWFLRVHPMTFVVLENLRYFLRDEDFNQPIYFGQKLRDTNTLFPFGFGGYVFSRQALKIFGSKGSRNPACGSRELLESVHIGECFNSLGIEFGDSRDMRNRSRFHGISVESIAVHDYQSWFHDLDPYDNMTKQGVVSVSNYAITFSPISDAVILSMEYFTYIVRVYGRLHNSIEINRKTKSLS